MRKLLTVGATLACLISVSVVFTRSWSQVATKSAPEVAIEPREPLRPLEADTVSVRLLLGVGDDSQRPWSGQVSVSPGEVLGVEGYRFRPGDEVKSTASWKAKSLFAAKAAAKKAVAKKKAFAAKKAGAGTPSIVPTGVVARVKAPAGAVLTLTTDQGNARIPLAELASGKPVRYLEGHVEARIVPTHAPLANSSGQEDYPAATPDGKTGAWVVYIDHQPRGPEAIAAFIDPPADFKSFKPAGGGDQVKLLHFDGKNVERTLDVTGPGLDIWRPAVTRAEDGKIVVAWSQMIGSNWDIHARTYDPIKATWADDRRITSDPGADTDPVLAVMPGGAVVIAWQGWRQGQADILLATVDHPDEVVNVSDSPANDWSPSLAFGPGGATYVAYDSYRNGNYDVFLWKSTPADGGHLRKTIVVAGTTKFEARPSLAVDSKGRAWLAYEERSEQWGKDFGPHARERGASLYGPSTVRVCCVDGDKVLDAGDPLAQALPTEQRKTSFPRITVDHTGRPWLVYRHQLENNWQGAAVVVVGAVWYEYATSLVGKTWTPPQPLPRSDNLLDNRPALAATPTGPVLAVYSTDNRLHRERLAGGPLQGQAVRAMAAVNNDVFVAALRSDPGAADPEPGGAVAVADSKPAGVIVHPNEAADVARMRAYRVKAAGKTYRLLRGEFHRHTEISPDGGGDGSLEDMWRYGLDAGALDWIGCGDHDNGNGREYTWWMTQKTTEMYHNPPAFMPLFTYERSVQYPGGHRNVMFPERGVRTLPRLVGLNGVRTDVAGKDEDAAMLFRYLHQFGGICAAHTSATDMGTDWRANDPAVEPFVEIYQGDRDSAEYLGAPRAAHGPRDALGGWRPLGMVWNALALQYKLGFQSSSDHISTHISYAVALAEEPTRTAIFDAFRQRHCYAATDNIVLDVRSGDHLMGDAFTQSGKVTLDVAVHGTGPIKRIDVIKDFHFAYSVDPKPGTARIGFTWTDEDGANRNPSWYYVRVIQEDGEIAWASPLWVSRSAAGP